jgi:hypothetical protein
VADLPIALPPGRRATYPADEAALRSLAAMYGVGDACARLLTAVARLGVTPASGRGSEGQNG